MPDQNDYVIHNPGNTKHIKSLYTILSVDKDGNEGICGINGMPFVMGYKDKFDKLLPQIRQMLKSQGLKGKIVRFEGRVDIEDL